MAIKQINQIKSYVFDSFEKAGLIQGVFCRHGGVSPAPWASLNQGGTVGDPRPNVIENRRRIFEAINRPVESLFDVWLVHSNTVLCTDKPRPLDSPHVQADAIITDRPEITLFMRYADCVPIFLYDPKKAVISMIHAGWRGTVNKICAETVKTMVAQYGCNPADILAGIGPSIGPDHFEIGQDVIEIVKQSFKSDADKLLMHSAGKNVLDLWATNALVLNQAGVNEIEISEICTACHTEDWFSHRGDHGKTGRFGALLALPG
jgi:YfiH family protein